MANEGQQRRLARKLERNLEQILKGSEGLTVNSMANAAGDWLVEVTPASWVTGSTYALIKIQEMPLSTFPVNGFPQHIIKICVEAGAVAGSAIIDAGLLAEIICRTKDLGCGIDMQLSATTVQPVDQATVGGTFNAGAATLSRHIRASVDTIGMGQ